MRIFGLGTHEEVGESCPRVWGTAHRASSRRIHAAAEVISCWGKEEERSGKMVSEKALIKSRLRMFGRIQI